MSLSGASTDRSFLKYGIAVFFLSGLFIGLFGIVSSNTPDQRVAMFFACGLNAYFALTIWTVSRKFNNFGIALLAALIPCCLSLAFRAPYIIFFLFALCLFFCIRYVWRVDITPRYWMIVFLFIVAAVYASIVLGTTQGTDIFFLSKMLVGQYGTDSFFHVAIASMIEHFGQASIGAHGLVPLNYYTFSHYLFGAFAYIAGIPVVASYSAIFSIVIIPLLFFSLSATSEAIYPSKSPAEYIFRLFLIALIFIGFLGSGPGSLSDRYAMWSSFFVSESYALSLILLLAMLSVMNIERFAIHAFTASLLIVLTCFTKTSTGLIAYSIYVMHLLLFCKFTYRQRFFLFSLVTLGTILCITSLASESPQILKINYFDFIKKYVQGENSETLERGSLIDFKLWSILFRFSIVHFFFSWVCFVLIVNSMFFDQAMRSLNIRSAMYNVIALLLGVVAVTFISLPSGAVYYFTNVSMFVAIPFILISLGTSFSTALKKRSIFGAAILLPAIILCIGVHNLKSQASILLGAAQKKPQLLAVTENNIAFADYIHQLESIRNTPGTEGMLIYVAKENVEFWAMETTASCMAQSFAIVAISERPAIFGLPEKTRCPVAFYGFNSYPEELFRLSAQPRISPEELLIESKKLGFKGYIDVTRTGWQQHHI